MFLFPSEETVSLYLDAVANFAGHFGPGSRNQLKQKHRVAPRTDVRVTNGWPKFWGYGGVDWREKNYLGNEGSAGSHYLGSFS